MKIRIVTNSTDVLKEAQKVASNLDISHGYSYGPGYEEEFNADNSVFVKFVKKVDKFVSFFAPVSQKEREISTEITKSSASFSDYLSKFEPDFLDHSSVVINSDSTLNKQIRNVAYEIAPHSIWGTKMAKGVSDEGPHAFLFDRKVVMNASSFNTENNNDFIGNLNNNIGLDKSVQLILLHEFSHIFQIVNNTKNGSQYDSTFMKIWVLSDRLTRDDKFLSKFKAQIENDPHQQFNPINTKFLSEVAVLPREIFADVGAILLRRNMEINNGTFDANQEKEIMKAIKESRNSEQLYHSEFRGHPSTAFDHFTSEGISHLEQVYDNLPSRHLSIEEISRICEKCIEVGFSRFVLTSIASNEESLAQFKNIFYLQPTTDENHKVIDVNLDTSNTTNHFISSVEQLRRLAGEDWVKSFEEKKEEINSLNLNQRKTETLTWQAGLHPQNYGQELAKIKSVDTTLDQIFTPTVASAKFEVPESMAGKIAAIREKALASSKSSTLKLD